MAIGNPSPPYVILCQWFCVMNVCFTKQATNHILLIDLENTYIIGILRVKREFIIRVQEQDLIMD